MATGGVIAADRLAGLYRVKGHDRAGGIELQMNWIGADPIIATESDKKQFGVNLTAARNSVDLRDCWKLNIQLDTVWCHGIVYNLEHILRFWGWIFLRNWSYGLASMTPSPPWVCARWKVDGNCSNAFPRHFLSSPDYNSFLMCTYFVQLYFSVYVLFSRVNAVKRLFSQWESYSVVRFVKRQ